MQKSAFRSLCGDSSYSINLTRLPVQPVEPVYFCIYSRFCLRDVSYFAYFCHYINQIRLQQRKLNFLKQRYVHSNDLLWIRNMLIMIIILENWSDCWSFFPSWHPLCFWSWVIKVTLLGCLPRISICLSLLQILVFENCGGLFGLGFQFCSWLLGTWFSHIPTLEVTLAFDHLNRVEKSIHFLKMASNFWVVQVTV